MQNLESDLPDELQAERKPAQLKEKPKMSAEERAARLVTLGDTIGKKRDEAVKARKESGIEAVWTACEEAYLGVDDANRGEFAQAKWAKPTSISGPVTTGFNGNNEKKSTAFVRLTARYVDMGAAKVSEIVLPIDDKAFSFEPNPALPLHALVKDNRPLTVNGQPVMRAVQNSAPAIQADPAAAAQAAQAGQPQQVAVTVADIAKIKMAEQQESCEKAEKRVYSWLIDCRYPMQMRKVIHDAARLGAGVLKGPFPRVERVKTYTVNGNVGVLEMVANTQPGVEWMDIWNLFPAAGCGENIHDGDHCFERDFMGEAKLRALKELTDQDGDPIYMGAQIDKVIVEGPDQINTKEGKDGQNPNHAEAKNRFTLWNFVGALNREDMVALGAPGAEDLPDSLAHCHAMVTMVNNTVIRATFNPLQESGNFPYRVLSWSRRAGHWAGVGVAEQVSMPQRMVNAGTRALLNNAGKSAGSQIAMDQRAVVPADGNWSLDVGDKLWFLTGDAVVDDIRKIFMTVTVPNLGPQIMSVIEYGFKLAEEASNIPLISQGQDGQTSPQTFGQAELQNSNGNTLLRDKAYAVDDSITEPMVQDLYEWLLLDPDVPVEEKGQFKINAHGSVAMVEKAIQEMTLASLGPLTLNPAYGFNPKLWAEEFVRTKRLDPRKLKYTPEELQKMEAAPPPEAPAVAAAKIRASTDLHKTEMTGQVTLKKAAMDSDRDTAYNESLAHRDEIQLQGQREELALRERLALLEYANKKDLTLDQVKAKLAETAMKLNVQKELSRDALAVDVHKHRTPPQAITPPTEPAGRAPNGEAFSA